MQSKGVVPKMMPMSAMQGIIGWPGKKQLLLPGLVQSGLAANDRVKYFAFLQQSGSSASGF